MIRMVLFWVSVYTGPGPIRACLYVPASEVVRGRVSYTNTLHGMRFNSVVVMYCMPALYFGGTHGVLPCTRLMQKHSCKDTSNFWLNTLSNTLIAVKL